MSKIRVHALAKELDIKSVDLMETLKKLEIPAKSNLSTLSAEEAERVRQHYHAAKTTKTSAKDALKQKQEEKKHKDEKKPAPEKKMVKQEQASQRKPKEKKAPQQEKKASAKRGSGENSHQKTQQERPQKKMRKTGKTAREKKKRAQQAQQGGSALVEIQPPVSVKEFADKISVPVAQVMTKLIALGMMITQNEMLDQDLIELLADEFKKKVVFQAPEEEETIEEKYDLDQEDHPNFLKERPPVITVMGHVDHGKTSLLDVIKSTRVTEGEAGGITQHIGAYTVNVKNKKVTFLDTPGHEAFTSMRSRGAQVTDIAVLVVAADDGVMPQTVEAINHARAAEVPIVVALNKMDKEGANPDRVKQELMEHNLIPEDWGGDTIVVPVSARTKNGIDELLDMILLVAEMQELKANPNRRAVGTVVEAQLDKGKGPMATVLVQKGTLRFGDSVVSGRAHGRIRAMTDDKDRAVKKAGPSTPVVILGLDEVPNAGDMIYAVEDDKLAREIAEKYRANEREEKLAQTSKVSLDNLFERIKEGELKDLNLIVKADVKGSVEAVSQSLLKLSNDEVKINVIHAGAGGITESDISLANASNALVIGFNVRPNINALDMAKAEDVDVRTYRVIYDIIEDVKAAVSGMLEPDIIEEIQGRCEVRQTFKLPNNSIVAGIYVLKGKILRNGQVKVLRDDVVIHEGPIASLKRFKDDAKEIAQGYEGGMTLENFNDIKVGDSFECFTLKEVKKEL